MNETIRTQKRLEAIKAKVRGIARELIALDNQVVQAETKLRGRILKNILPPKRKGK